MRQGAASHRKIGGNLQGEPIFLLTREAPAHGRDQTLPEGFVNTDFRRRADNTGNGQTQIIPAMAHRRVFTVEQFARNIVVVLPSGRRL